MTELIDKWKVVDMLTALENELQQYKPFTEREYEIYRRIVELEMVVGKTPAVESEPVVHARWIVPDDNYPDTCSNCLFEFVWDGDDDYHPKRCPHCGAHMDEEVADG